MSQERNIQQNRVKDLTHFEDFLELTRRFPQSYLLIGSGARLQFANPKQAIEDVITQLGELASRPTLIIFGGDTAHVDQPDLGYLVQQLKIRFHDTVTVVSVQSWSNCCPFVDYVFKYPRAFCEKSKRELWGGVQNGLPVAATRYYLHHTVQHALTALICIGGGKIAKQELAYTIGQGILQFHYIRTEVRHHRELSLYGPAYDWYITLQEKEKEYKRSQTQKISTKDLRQLGKNLKSTVCD